MENDTNDDIFQDTIDWASEKSEERTRSVGIPLFYLILIALVILIILVFVFYYISKTTDDSEDALELIRDKKYLNDETEYYDVSENMEIDEDYPNSDQNEQDYSNYSDQNYPDDLNYSNQGEYSDQDYQGQEDYSNQGME